jgi:acetyl esterase/lipase
MPWALLSLSVLSLALTVNAWRPVRTPAPIAVVCFFASWLTGELALHSIAAQVAITAVFLVFGGLRALPGVVAIPILIASWALLYAFHARADEAARAFGRALEEALGGEPGLAPQTRGWLETALDWRALAMPFPVRRRGVRRVRNVAFHEHDGVRLELDVVTPRETPKGAPTFVYVHGGGWVIGQRQYQGLPLMQHLAARGWVCFSVDYRLSPRATFPDHLVDVKRALAWVRAHAAEYGADPALLAIGGNSAGAHLAALAALTPNDPEYQPGFEEADTSVDACLAFYGVYDLLVDRNAHWPDGSMRRLLERIVMKEPIEAARAAYEKASPIERVHRGAPPFLLVHGTCDTLAPVCESRRFAGALRKTSLAPVVYAEIPLAQHAFEIFPSRRTAHVLDGVASFVAWLYSRHLERKSLERKSLERESLERAPGLKAGAPTAC